MTVEWAGEGNKSSSPLWESGINPAIIAGFPKHSAAMSVKIVDSFEFCQQQQQSAGQTPVAEFARLSAELASSAATLDWVVTGGRHAVGVPQLLLNVSGQIQLVCQRCLSPMVHAMASESTLLLAKDDADADEIEARIDDESLDVIVGSTSQDLMVLVEDEALLALPLSPRHAQCPGDVPTSGVDKPESPFAVLKKLK